MPVLVLEKIKKQNNAFVVIFQKLWQLTMRVSDCSVVCCKRNDGMEQGLVAERQADECRSKETAKVSVDTIVVVRNVFEEIVQVKPQIGWKM